MLFIVDQHCSYFHNAHFVPYSGPINCLQDASIKEEGGTSLSKAFFRGPVYMYDSCAYMI